MLGVFQGDDQIGTGQIGKAQVERISETMAVSGMKTGWGRDVNQQTKQVDAKVDVQASVTPHVTAPRPPEPGGLVSRFDHPVPTLAARALHAGDNDP